MENLDVNLDADLLELSPLKMPNSILKPSQKDNLIMLQTPVQKHLKVSFITPKRTPIQVPLQPTKSDENSNISTPVSGLNLGQKTPVLGQNFSTGFDTLKSQMPTLKQGMNPRRVGVSSHDMLPSAPKCVTSTEKPQTKSLKSDSMGNKWESLRELDESSRWRDRVEVITKLDHEEHIKFAKELIMEMVDKAMDKVESKQITTTTNRLENINTSISKILTPQSASNSGLLSPIAKSSNFTPSTLLLGSEVVTPVSKYITTSGDMKANGTFDISNHGSFIAERPCIDAEGQNNDATSENCQNLPSKLDDDSFKAPSGVLKPLTARQHGQQHTQRSQSISERPAKDSFKIGTRSYSFSLDNIPEEFDPFSPRRQLKNSTNEKVNEVSKHGAGNGLIQTPNTTFDSSASGNVFSSVEKPKFAMRDVDREFGGESFVDGSTILDLDYLEQKTSGAISADLRKQSLYVKFDPLLEGLGNRQSIVLLGRKSDIIDFTGRVTPVPEDIQEEAEVSPREVDLLCDSPSQIGVENSNVSVTQIPRGSTSSKGESVSSCPSPRLSIVPGSKGPDTGIIEVLKYSEADRQKIINRKRQKWNKERSSCAETESELNTKLQFNKILIQEYQQRLEERAVKIAEEKKDSDNKISSLKEEMVKLDGQIAKLTRLSIVVPQRMESLQKTLANYKSNEQKQKNIAKSFREQCTESQKKIMDLELQHAENIKAIKTETAATEANMTTQLHNLQMKIRATELRVTSLKAEHDNKLNANQELLKICEELMATNEAKNQT